MGEVQLLWGVEAWIQAKLDGKESEYDDLLNKGEYMLHGTKLVDALRVKPALQQLKIQKLLVPVMKANVLGPIATLKGTPGFGGQIVMPNKTHPSGFKLWPVQVVIDKFTEKLTALEKGPTIETLAKATGYAMYGSYCMGCGKRESFMALKNVKAYEAPRMFFEGYDPDEIAVWAMQRHKLQKAHWSQIPAWCTDCRLKCSQCSKSLPRKINWEWLSSLLNDGQCHVCGGDRLVNVQAPRPDRKSLAQISHRFIIG